jgi:hypothetical protein
MSFPERDCTRQSQGQCEARAESTSLLDGYAEPMPALGKAKGKKDG